MCEVKLKPRDSVLNTEVSLKEEGDVLPSQIQEESSKALVFFGGKSIANCFPIKVYSFLSISSETLLSMMIWNTVPLYRHALATLF